MLVLRVSLRQQSRPARDDYGGGERLTRTISANLRERLFAAQRGHNVGADTAVTGRYYGGAEFGVYPGKQSAPDAGHLWQCSRAGAAVVVVPVGYPGVITN